MICCSARNTGKGVVVPFLFNAGAFENEVVGKCAE
jgi:hypothetical protein